MHPSTADLRIRATKPLIAPALLEEDVLTFAVPLGKFRRMASNMDESSLTAASWARARRRIAKAAGAGE